MFTYIMRLFVESQVCNVILRWSTVYSYSDIIESSDQQ